MGPNPGTRPRWPVAAGICALTIFTVAGTIGASHNQGGRRGLDSLALAVAVAAPASLAMRSRWPRAVLWFVVALTVVYLLRDYPYSPLFATLAITVVAAVATGYRATGWAAMATVVASFGVRHAMSDEPWSWRWLSAAMAWALLLLAVGEVIRIRHERSVVTRQARVESSRRQANQERLQIARELHDVVAHHISLINVQAAVALHIVDRQPAQARTALEAIKDASKEALVELRSLVGVLRDEEEAAPRRPTSTLAALDDLVTRSRSAGLAVSTSIDGAVRPLPASVELSAVRIIQEAITNVIRHSGADRADVRLAYEDDSLAVTVEDNGRGVGDKVTRGSGLIGMRERAEALGGSFQVGNASSGGVRVQATLPLAGTP